MARLITFLFLLIICVTATAQNKQDVVYLKNGGILRGNILQNDSIVKIEILGGNVFVYSKAEIEKINQEEAIKIIAKGPITPQQNGWYNEYSFGIPYGIDQWGWPTAGVTLNYFIGHQFNQLVKTGIGTGLDIYGYQASLIPFYGRITGDLTSKTKTPFYFADLGYATNVSIRSNNEKHYGGFLMHLGGGIKINTRRRTFFNLSASYNTQFTKSYYFQTWLEEPYWEYRQYNRIEGRISIGF